MAGEDEFHDDNPPPPPPPVTHNTSFTLCQHSKLPIMKKDPRWIAKVMSGFLSLRSQLEIHGAGCLYTEDAQSEVFFRSLPASLVPCFYLHSFFPAQRNVAVCSSESTRHGPQLDHEDLEQLDEFDLEKIDLKWQVAMISIRLKKFYKKTGKKLQFDAKEPVGFDRTKVECFNWETKGFKAKDNGRRPEKIGGELSLVNSDEDGVDWLLMQRMMQENFDLMAVISQPTCNSGSDTEVTSCSKECVESYAKLKKLYDEQREQLGDASIEIKAYTLALAKVEAQLVCHQKNQLVMEEKIKFMK
ncbi:hypothetical protein Tco_0556841 [Tanacetum coccineum]